MKPDNISPYFSSNNIAICLSSSNEYSVFLSVAILSIVENSNKLYNYDIVIMNTDMSPGNKQKISSISANHPNIAIRFIELNDIISGMNFYTWAHFTQFTYYRLLIHSIFYNYKKIIYLDSDIIVDADISILYNQDVTGFLFAAARDTHVVGRLNSVPVPTTATYYLDTLHILDNRSYFQCGVMLFNIVEMRATFPDGFLIKEATLRKYMWLDQDLMNTNCKGMIKILPNVWNLMVFNNPKNIDEYFLPDDLKREYFAARTNPKIVHYIGKSIPCYDPFGDFNTLYWRYARKSPFYEYLLNIMFDVKLAKARR